MQAKCRALGRGGADRINLIVFDSEGELGDLRRCAIRGLLGDGSMALFRVIMSRGADLVHDIKRERPQGQLLSTLLGDGPVEPGLKDRERQHQFISEYAAGLVGMAASDLAGQLTTTALPPEAAATIAEATRHVVDSSEIACAEVLASSDHADHVDYALKFPVRRWSECGKRELCPPASTSARVSRVIWLTLRSGAIGVSSRISAASPSA